MENVKYKICYWYHEYQDMSASVPTCDYYRQYGECPCEPECEHFITKKEVDDIVRNMSKIGQMSDLISRTDAIEALEKNKSDWDNNYNRPIDKCIFTLRTLPSAEAVSREDYHNLLMALNDIDRALRQYQAKYENPSAEAEDRLYIKIYADDEPSVKAEKLYQICGETQNKEVTEWLKEYFPLSDDNWIPVSERLPENKEETYWVCTDTEYQCECRWTNISPIFTYMTTDWHWNWFDIPQYTKVTAWQPLPTPYKESEVEE